MTTAAAGGPTTLVKGNSSGLRVRIASGNCSSYPSAGRRTDPAAAGCQLVLLGQLVASAAVADRWWLYGPDSFTRCFTAGGGPGSGSADTCPAPAIFREVVTFPAVAITAHCLWGAGRQGSSLSFNRHSVRSESAFCGLQSGQPNGQPPRVVTVLLAAVVILIVTSAPSKLVPDLALPRGHGLGTGDTVDSVGFVCARTMASTVSLSLLHRVGHGCYRELWGLVRKNESEVVFQHSEEVAHPVRDRFAGGCGDVLPHC